MVSMASAQSDKNVTIELAAAHLRQGQPVAIPTETVYGLAANAFDRDAVLKVFKLKQRPLFDPLIVHVSAERSTLAALHEQGVIDSAQMTERQKSSFQSLTSAFWPGPLTVVLPRGPKVADLVSSGLSTVGIRVPAHVLTQTLLASLPFPLAAPSANRFGRVSPTTARHVADEFGSDLGQILDGGECVTGVESTVVLLLGSGDILVLRPGGVSRERIEMVTGRRAGVQSLPSGALVGASPGTMENHYAPPIPLILLKNMTQVADQIKGLKIAVLCVNGAGAGILQLDTELLDGGADILLSERLSETENDEEAARNLFAALRRCGACGASLIVANQITRDDGLWLAIADRLRKASFKGDVSQLLSQLRAGRGPS